MLVRGRKSTLFLYEARCFSHGLTFRLPGYGILFHMVSGRFGCNVGVSSLLIKTAVVIIAAGKGQSYMTKGSMGSVRIKLWGT